MINESRDEEAKWERGCLYEVMANSDDFARLRAGRRAAPNSRAAGFLGPGSYSPAAPTKTR